MHEQVRQLPESPVAVARSCGFRRVHRVALVPDASGAVGAAYVEGVVHRAPRWVRVPLRTAARLVRAGVPVERAAGAGRERGARRW